MGCDVIEAVASIRVNAIDCAALCTDIGECEIEQSHECRQHRCAYTLTHGRREDQIACAEDKSEEHRGNEDIFLLFQPSFHLQNLSIK